MREIGGRRNGEQGGREGGRRSYIRPHSQSDVSSASSYLTGTMRNPRRK